MILYGSVLLRGCRFDFPIISLYFSIFKIHCISAPERAVIYFIFAEASGLFNVSASIFESRNFCPNCGMYLCPEQSLPVSMFR